MPFEDRFTVGDPYLRTKWLPLDPEISPRAQAAHPNSLARLICALTPPMVLSPMLARLEIEIKKRRTHEKQEKNDELCDDYRRYALDKFKISAFFWSDKNQFAIGYRKQEYFRTHR